MKSKLIITESQFNELMYTKLGILTEASKLKILTDKEGLDQDQAELLDELCGSLSVWMLGKINGWQKDILNSWDNKNEIWMEISPTNRNTTPAVVNAYKEYRMLDALTK